MKIIWLVFLLLRLQAVYSQNLLANGGFEDENICTEYHKNCAPEAWLPNATAYIFYWNDPSLAHSGEHLMAILAGHSKILYKRIYIRSRIVCSLRKGHQYQLSFFVKSKHPILDSVGVYFTNYDFLFEKRLFREIIPSAYAADAAIKAIKGDTSWQQLVINYTATGEENFLTFGYFAKNDLKGSTGIPKENNFLFLLDDIKMIPLDPEEKICNDWVANTDTIYAQNERHEYLDMEMRLYKYDQQHIKAFTATAIPVVAPPKIMPLIDTLVILDVLFTSGSAVLKNESHELLDSFCNAITKKSFDSLLVEGHTDSVGTLSYNMKLSADRAQAVAGYLQQKIVIDDDKFFIRHYAYYKPVAANSSVQGRRKNRRVEIFVYRHQ